MKAAIWILGSIAILCSIAVLGAMGMSWFFRSISF